MSLSRNRRCLVWSILIGFVLSLAAFVQSAAASTDEPKPKPTVVGYIWLGNLQPGGKVEPATVRLADGSTVLKYDQLKANTALVSVNNLYVRGGMPRNDNDYFRGQPVVGLVATGTAVKLLDNPESVSRSNSSLVQLWGHIEVTVATQ